MPAVFHDTSGVAFMLASEAASLALAGFCYYMVYRYFSGSALYTAGEMQQMFLNSFHGKGAFKKGTGLSNVNAVAERYGGAMSIETQENVFVLHVLLIIPQHPESSPQQMG